MFQVCITQFDNTHYASSGLYESSGADVFSWSFCLVMFPYACSDNTASSLGQHDQHIVCRVDSRFAPNQWETALLCKDVSHWLGASLESALVCTTLGLTLVLKPGPWFNIKMPSYQYRKFHCGDKTVVRSSYLHNGISYIGKLATLYWISHKTVLFPQWDFLYW